MITKWSTTSNPVRTAALTLLLHHGRWQLPPLRHKTRKPRADAADGSAEKGTGESKTAAFKALRRLRAACPSCEGKRVLVVYVPNVAGVVEMHELVCTACAGTGAADRTIA